MKRPFSSLLAALLLVQSALPVWAAEESIKGPQSVPANAAGAIQTVSSLDVSAGLAPAAGIPGAAEAVPRGEAQAAAAAAAAGSVDAAQQPSTLPNAQAELGALGKNETVAAVVAGPQGADAASRRLFDKTLGAGAKDAALEVSDIGGTAHETLSKLPPAFTYVDPVRLGIDPADFPKGSRFKVYRGHDVAALLEKALARIDSAHPASDEVAEAGKLVDAAISKLDAGSKLLENAAHLVGRLRVAKRLLDQGRYGGAPDTIRDVLAKLPINVDEVIALAMLDMRLGRMALPPVKTARRRGKADYSQPTVAILAPASFDKMTLAREGGRQSAGDLHLSLDPSWLVKVETPDQHDKLLLRRGLVFDKAGKQATIVNYDKPRLVRYFGDFYTLGANDRADGVALERNLDTPTSSSVQSEPYTNDKLRTRVLAAAAHWGVPRTLALYMPANTFQQTVKKLGNGQRMVQAQPMPSFRDGVAAALDQYLVQYTGQEVVIKPSGPQFHSGRGVKIFKRDQLDEMVDHIIALERDPQMTQDGAVLIDSRVSPPAIYLRTAKRFRGLFGYLGRVVTPLRLLRKGEISKAEPWEKKDWNFRVEVARHPSGNAVTTGIFARAGTWGAPTTAEAADPRNNAAVISFETVVEALQKQHGLLKTQAEVDEFRAELDAMGEGVLRSIWADEKRRERAEGEARQAQTDFIGLDVMVEVENGKLKPKLIEVNDHDSGGMYELDGFSPERPGLGVREWVQTMLARASRDAMKGKRIVMVGAGYVNKRPFLETARKLGVKIVLVDRAVVDGQPNWAKDLVDEFIDADLTHPQEGVRDALAKLKASISENGKLDGITTYWEDDITETAKLAQALGLPFHPVEVAEIARSKHRTIEVLRGKGVIKGRHTYRIASRADLEKLVEIGAVPGKWFLKPSGGAEAQMTGKYYEGDVLAVYDRLAATMAQSKDDVYKDDRTFQLTDYLAGNEWDYNVTVQDGKLLDDRPTDNWPTRAHSSKATGSSLPPRAMTAGEKKHARAMVKQIVKALGIRDGVLHIEGIGKELLEINLRPGGSYTLDWNRKVWGVDEAEMLLMTAAGVRAFPAMPRKPFTCLEGAFVFTPLRGKVKKIALTEEGRKAGLHLIVEKKAGKLVTDDEDRVAMIYAEGKDNAEALGKLGGDPSRWLELEVEPVR